MLTEMLQIILTAMKGEYAAISTNANDIFGTPANGRLTFPTMQSAAGEAAFMTGLERNSDIVFVFLLDNTSSTYIFLDLRHHMLHFST